MRVFVTGATGYIGNATVQELLRAGHQVLGLARSDASAAVLQARGAAVHRGDLEDLPSLQAGAKAADAVIHLAFIHDFQNYVKSGEIDKRAIEAIGEALAGTQKPFIVSTSLAFIAPGSVASEETRPAASLTPRVSEDTALTLAARGINAIVVRLPVVYGEADIAFIPLLIGSARRSGAAAYLGDGRNSWPTAGLDDIATLYRLVLERGKSGAIYHGAAESLPLKEIAGAIAARLNVPVVSKSPEEFAAAFGWFAAFAALDQPASSTITQEALGWKPQSPSLLQVLAESKTYFEPNPRALSLGA